MAATLVLGVPQRVTLSLAVEQITVPQGSRQLKISSASEVFYEDSATADGGVATPASQFRYEAGTFTDRLPGMGTTEQTSLSVDTIYRFVGSSASQFVWFWAVAEI